MFVEFSIRRNYQEPQNMMTFSGQGFPQIRKNTGIFRRWREGFFCPKFPEIPEQN